MMVADAPAMLSFVNTEAQITVTGKGRPNADCQRAPFLLLYVLLQVQPTEWMRQEISIHCVNSYTLCLRQINTVRKDQVIVLGPRKMQLSSAKLGDTL